MHTIGVDIGTTSIGYAVVDTATHRARAFGSYPHHAALPSPHDTCQDVELLYRAVVNTLAELRAWRQGTAAIGVSGQMHGILYIDSDGEACSALYSWLYPGALPYLEEIAQRSGYTIPAGYGVATHYANMRAGIVPPKAVALCTIMDYVVMKLCGLRTPVSDPTCAASLGGYRIEDGGFDDAALRLLGIGDVALPRVAATASIVGETVAGVPLAGAAGVPVAAPIGDNQASYIGACGITSERTAAQDDTLVLNIGTSAQISMCDTAHRTHRSSAIEWRPLYTGRYLAVGSTLSGGKSLEILARFCAGVCALHDRKPLKDIYYGIEKFQRAWIKRDSRDEQNGEALRVTPHFAGSRDHPTLRGAIKNIGMNNFDIERLTYGFMDGIIDESYDLWKQGGFRAPSAIVGSGSALRRNPLLQRIASERWGVELRIPPHTEEAAVGAAHIARLAMA